tara:strand:+ start:2249 stop:3049 length:801 start_codon:yes stop_codon:yes gene_type:complete
MNASDHITRLKEDGWTVVENVVPEAHIEDLKRQIQASTDEHGTERARKMGIGHVGGFIAFNQALAPYLADRRVIEPVQGILGPHIKISFTTATINMPENPRGTWHADWPFNQNNAGHVEAPYPDVPMHITTLWMLSPFSEENGGTLIVPGSHREPNNPTCDIGVDPSAPYPGEINACGDAGSVLVLDSRMWHSTAANTTSDPRVSVVVRYAPWWLNTRVLCDSLERKVLGKRTGLADNDQPLVPKNIYENLPEDVKPLFSHWVAEA